MGGYGEKIREAHVSVQLPDEAGEIVVLKILRQYVSREFGHIPNNKAVVVITPWHHRVGGRVIHHVISLTQKWRRRIHTCRRRRIRRPTVNSIHCSITATETESRRSPIEHRSKSSRQKESNRTVYNSGIRGREREWEWRGKKVFYFVVRDSQIGVKQNWKRRFTDALCSWCLKN